MLGRYTLTEGDFHHLKNARLTHLHLPPPALKIVTIHECESSENSLAMTPRLPPPKPGLAIFQVRPSTRGDGDDQGMLQRPREASLGLGWEPRALLDGGSWGTGSPCWSPPPCAKPLSAVSSQPPAGALPRPALPSHAVCPSSALPGDTFNSTVDTSFAEASPATSSDSGEGPSVSAGVGGRARAGEGALQPGQPAQPRGSCPALRRDVGIQLETASAPPPRVPIPCPGGHWCICRS